MNFDTRTSQDLIANDLVVAKSRFFLHTRTGVLAFAPSAGLSPRTFAQRFKAIVEQDQFFFQADIEMIQERFSVVRSMAEFGKIRNIRISLHPSNPGSHKIWERFDNKLQNYAASRYEERIEGKPHGDGLNKDAILGDEDLTAKITMAEDGYGKARVTGELDGEPKTVTTGDNPITTTISEGGGEEKETHMAAFSQLHDTINRLLGRFVNEE